MAGSVFGIFLWPDDPMKLVVVPNIKRDVWKAEFNRIAAELLRENGEYIDNFRDFKALYKYVSLELQKRGTTISRMAKKNSLGLPGGEINQDEIDSYPNDEAYAAFALAREYSEETGLVIARAIMDPADPLKQKLDKNGYPLSEDLFENVLMLSEPERNDKTKVYENYFFRVRGVFPDPKKTLAEILAEHPGVEEETGPPELWNITELTPACFYPKHAWGVKAVLEKLIAEGHSEYVGAVNHLQTEYERPWGFMINKYKKAMQQDRREERQKETATEKVPETWEEFVKNLTLLRK